MQVPNHFIGIDISSTEFSASLFSGVSKTVSFLSNFENTTEGFNKFIGVLTSKNISKDNSFLCMEATGVYGEYLAYYIVSSGYSICIENPLKVKRAFDISKKKTDQIDSQKIAEYAFRFFDELKPWTPKSAIIEQIRALLTQREQFSVQRVANINAKKAILKKFIRPPAAVPMYDEMISKYEENIRKIETLIKDLIKEEPEYKQTISNLTSIPGVGDILAFNILALVEGFPGGIDHKKLASYIGICPLPFESGSSVYRRAKASKIGPSRLRKILYMCSMSVSKHNPEFRKYFERKVIEGKAKKLVLNNIANKLLKLIMAILKSKKPFYRNFVSVNPVFSKSI